MNGTKVVWGLTAIIVALGIWSIFLVVHPTPSPTQAATPAPAPQAQPADQSKTQTNEEGNVSVAVTPVDLVVGKPAKFSVAINNHMISLDFDMSAISRMSDDKGTEYGAPQWDGAAPGGHHRSGTLTFSPSITAGVSKVTVVLKGIGSIPERIFMFSL